ncbi:MAG: hypothetical protein EOO70_06190 [Myxococcaceae bacterium]|nr:MAG: hypothetical protein EOO70_06190 [Myxococcaceae bacterium]
MGPVYAESHPGQRLVRPPQAGPGSGDDQRPRGRATIELDYGYRGSTYVYGAFTPGTGRTLTACYSGKRVCHWLDFLERTDAWIDPGIERVLAIVDNLATHRHDDVLYFMLTHPRWEFVFIPRYAGYLNLIEPWWKTLRSLALAGRRLENVDELKEAVERATSYWNDHKHPYLFGRARRRKTPRKPGIAGLPGHRLTT